MYELFVYERTISMELTAQLATSTECANKFSNDTGQVPNSIGGRMQSSVTRYLFRLAESALGRVAAAGGFCLSA